MRYLFLAAALALGACKAEKTRGENDSIAASRGGVVDSGPAAAGGINATPGTSGAAASADQPAGMDTAKASDTTKAGTRRP